MGIWELAEQRVVAFDVDSVLFPINEWVVLPYLRSYGYDIELEDITAFDYGDPVIKRLAFRQFQRTNLYDDFTVEPAVARVLDVLRKRYRVIAVSSPFAQHASSKWSYCQRAGFAHEDIVLCGDKTLVGFDVLVDDKAETVEQLGPRRAVVFDRPWNRGVTGISRADGWGEVIPAIEEVLYGRAVGAVVPVDRPGAGTCTHGRSLRGRCDACGVAAL